MQAPSKILIATDFSAPARHAVELGATLAARLGAEVLVLHVYTLPIVMIPETVVAITPRGLAEEISHREGALGEVVAQVRKLGVEHVAARVVEGTAWQEIVRVAAAEACDLIVVGTHGHGRVLHFLLGSVAERVVRAAGRPVLVAGHGNTPA